jgi:hypothetical protein
MQNIKDRKIVLVNIVGYCEGGGEAGGLGVTVRGHT